MDKLKLGEWRLIMDCPHVQDNTRAAIARERCEECDRQHEADATLGAFVRALPDGYVLHHVGGEWAAYRIRTGPWRHSPKQCPSIKYMNTPEEAIAAALAKGGDDGS